MQQRTEEWFTARLGKVTASRISDVIAKGRSGAPSVVRTSYMAELITETMTGVQAVSFKGNADTDRGIELEPEALATYELQSCVFIESVGFVVHPRIERAGSSPDGLVGKDGLVETKAPRPHIHIGYILKGEPPSEYMPQMAWQAACCERKWVDFVSYCPVMPERLRLFVARYVPEPSYIAELEKEAALFLAEMMDKIKRLEAA